MVRVKHTGKASKEKKVHFAVPEGVEKEQRRKRWHPGTKALREVRHYQKTTELILPRAPIVRLIHEVVQEVRPGSTFRFAPSAVTAIQEAVEALLVQGFEGAQICGIHGKRKTVMPKDMQLAERLQGR